MMNRWMLILANLSSLANIFIVLALLVMFVRLVYALKEKPNSIYYSQIFIGAIFVLCCSLIAIVDLFPDSEARTVTFIYVKIITGGVSFYVLTSFVHLRQLLRSVMNIKDSEALDDLNRELAKEVEANRKVGEQLTRAERQFKLFLQHAHESIMIAGRNGVIEYANIRAHSMFGYDANEILGKSVVELTPIRAKEYANSMYSKLFLSNQARSRLFDTEKIGVRKDGTEFPVEIGLSQLEIGSREVMLATVRDISQRKVMEEKALQDSLELAHMSRLSSVGQMAAGLAHELNQPLTTISNNLYTAEAIIQRSPDPDPELLSIAQENYAAAQHAGRIIRSLRQMVGKNEGSKKLTNINELVEATANLVRPQAKSASIDVRVRLDSDLPQLYVNPVQIQQVVLNLCVNSVEALDDLDKDETLKLLTISTEFLHSECVRVTVSDNGPGLTADVKKKLFQPYITSKEKGMGLGLSICRTFIESQGGLLKYRQANSGGAVFYFTFEASSLEERE